MLRVREKEIENSKKQIDLNNIQITKLREKLIKLGGTGGEGDDKTPVDWEQKYKGQVQLRTRLEKAIKQLEKQNVYQGNVIEKVTKSDD